MKDNSTESISAPIAIIGMGCRFPGGNGPKEFWDMLVKGTDCITEVPPDRWDVSTFYSSNKDKAGKAVTKHGGFIEDFDRFDPSFFGIFPREAEAMDPQQRKLLEVTWEALEDGGLKPEELAGEPVGVFIGAFTLDYKIIQFSGGNNDNLVAHTPTGTMMTMVSNRLSHVFDFRGPSLSLDTACSSSLLAVHLACESIRNGESTLAVAGGTQLQFTPQYAVAESKGGFLSPTGWSHAFDSSANGYVRGEGVAVVVLKKLEDALRDGDPVYAQIIGSGACQDGRTKGITVPRGEAQKELIKRVCARAGINPGDLQYIEAHGTGTPVGDPIEANALGEVMSIGRRKEEKCFIGSVKTNIGHTEAAAGVAGLIKAVLSLKNRMIPPHLHFSEINPKIDIERWPYEIPRKLEPWPEHTGPARAGVNSFGFGGTNVHVVLQEAPLPETTGGVPAAEADSLRILPLSARDGAVLPALADRYRKALDERGQAGPLSLDDVGYTASIRRQHHEHRLAILYSTREDLLGGLDSFIREGGGPRVLSGRKGPEEERKIVWVFTGMGPQWWGMGRELFEKEPLYRGVIEECDRIMRDLVDWSLLEELMADEERSRMNETWLSQPANFALQVALSALWRSYGIRPDAIVGHSTGEAAAFHEAGVYSLEDALKVIVHRSRLQDTLRGTGGMVAVGLPLNEVMPLVEAYGDRVSVAAVNAPQSVTLAGDEQALIELTGPLQEREVFCRFLRVDIPFHSAYMDAVRDELLESLRDITPSRPAVPLYSTALGERVEDRVLDASYWWRNVRGTVLFERAVKEILDDGYTLFLEIGPHPVLAASISECMAEKKREGKVLASLRRKEGERERFLASLAELYTMGCRLNWERFYPGGECVRLPAYPWKRERYWMEPADVRRTRLGGRDHPLLGLRPSPSEPSWETSMDIETRPYLADHQIEGNIVFPAAGYIEMAFSALRLLRAGGSFTIRDLEFRKALFLSRDVDPRVRCVVDEERSAFRVVSTPREEGRDVLVHAVGVLQTGQEMQTTPTVDIDALKSGTGGFMNGEECYDRLRAAGYHYGPCFRGIKGLWFGKGEVLAEIEPPKEVLGESSQYYFHPAILDVCFHVMLAGELAVDAGGEGSAIRLPVGIETVRLQGRPPERLWAHAVYVVGEGGRIRGDITLYDDAGKVVGNIDGFVARGVDTSSGGVSAGTIDKWLYEVEWLESVPPASGSRNGGREAGWAWLILADSRGVGEEVSRLLRGQGDDCRLVYPGDGSGGRDNGRQTIAPGSLEEMRELMRSFFGGGRKGRAGLLHLWNLDAPPTDGMSPEELRRVRRLGCHSLLDVVRTSAEINASPELWVITAGAHHVGDNGEDIRVAAAPVWGMGRVFAQQEVTENWGGLVDIDPRSLEDGESVRRAAELICSEIGNPDGEDQIAYRDGRRYVPRLNPATALTRTFPTVFRSDASYLVTGAFGAIGRFVCRMLARGGARRLVLMARTVIPPRTEWEEIDALDGLAAKIDFIKELESLGVHVIPLSADITDEDQLGNAFREFRRRGYPPIRGVVHSAGSVKDAMAVDMDRETFDSVYDTKVVGSYLLHKCLDGEPLDHFVLFSSVASLVTTAGQSNYAAGNAFLDSLAHYRRSKGLAAISINWGPWAIGMIRELDLVEHYRSRRGMNSIIPQAGMAILDRMMSQDVSQVVVCEADWRVALDWYPKDPPFFAHLADNGDEKGSADDAVGFPELFASAAEESRGELVLRHFKDLIAGALRSDPARLDGDASLGSLGVDSMMVTELRNRISHYFGQSMPIVKLLSNSTIGQLAGELTTLLSRSLDPGRNAAESPSPSGDADSVRIAPGRLREVTGDPDATEAYALSYGQKAIWFLNRLLPGSPAYNIVGVVRIPTALDVPILRKALREVISRHPSLRTRFFTKDGEIYQKVLSSPVDDFEVIDVSGVGWDALMEMIREESRIPFDLEKGPLLRSRLYKRSEEEYLLLNTIYHIISDATSNYILINELQFLYDKYKNGKDAQLPPLETTYADFVGWQQRMLAGGKGEEMFLYWKNHLPEDIPILNLPLDKPRPAVQTDNGSSFSLSLGREKTQEIKALAKSTDTTVFMVLLSAFFILLHKYSSQEEIIVGTPVGGRTRERFSDVYGYFVNPLPLLASFKGDPAYGDFLSLVRKTVLTGLENQDFPFSLLVERLGTAHDPSRSAIFQAMFIFLVHKIEQTGVDEEDTPEYRGFPMEYIEVPEEEGQFDITLSVYEDRDGFRATFKYNVDLFFESTIARMAEHYNVVLGEILRNPSLRISEYNLMSEAERALLLNDWGNAGKEFDTPLECVHELIRAKALKRPDAPALAVPRDNGEALCLSYGELDEESDRLAGYLRDVGVGPGVPVGVCMEKSPEMITSLLAVLKAGGAFVPVDPDHPPDRIDYILENSGAGLVICHSSLKHLIRRGPSLCVDTIPDDVLKDRAAPENLNTPSDTAYIIYTSGSTGQPKGIAVTHRALMSVYEAWEREYELGDADVHLQMCSFSFDVFCGDFARALCSGGKLVLCGKEILLNLPLLYRVMKEQGVNKAEFVPAIMRRLTGYLDSTGESLDFMDLVVVGSDTWTVDEYRELKSCCGKKTRVVNSYGLSEATIDSTYFEGDVDCYERGTAVPIGRPFPNTSVYILDPFMNPAPIGVPGELYIGGNGLAAGYVDEDIAGKGGFITHSFDGAAETRIYRTGDIAKWDERGNILMLHRLDNQVKIRGYRIELEEIERQASSLKNVERAVALAAGGNNGKADRIYLYYKPERDASVGEQDLLSFLREKLPGYMLPSVVIQVSEFPLTANGKVDMKALPQPGPGSRDGVVEEPRNLYERKIAGVWTRLLGVESVDVGDDFFGLGGNSLDLVQLMIELQNEFNIVLSVNRLYKVSTLEGMAKTIEDIVTGKEEGAAPFFEFNPGNERVVYCFPPAGGYSLVYASLAESMPDVTLVSFNYLPGEDKVALYADMILELGGRSPLLFGYSLGGNIAFEVGKELEARGVDIAGVVIMDSHRITGTVIPGAEDMANFEEELSEHLKAHTGSAVVRKHTLEQARDYVEFCYRKGNPGTVRTEVHYIVESKDDDLLPSERRNSWNGSSLGRVHIHQGSGKHADMLNSDNVRANAGILYGLVMSETRSA